MNMISTLLGGMMASGAKGAGTTGQTPGDISGEQMLGGTGMFSQLAQASQDPNSNLSVLMKSSQQARDKAANTQGSQFPWMDLMR